MKICLLTLMLFAATLANAQNTLNVTVSDTSSGETMPGASVYLKGTTSGSTTDINGKAVLNNIPDGAHTIVISFVGYENKERSLAFPPAVQSITVALVPAAIEHEVTVRSTRANKTIQNSPTRTEILTEEIAEAADMEPGRIAHLLTHSTGIQVQQTSAGSGYANVRIQGLDGRYALILKDGFPLYGGFSGNLGIMHIPPLDLAQVEYIKGPASTLYGAGAISGMINLISKEPTPEGDYQVMFNRSHIGATDLNAFLSKRKDKVGLTVYAGYDRQEAFDANDDDFSDLPLQNKFNFNPRLYLFPNEKTQIMLGASLTTERRIGGDMNLMNNEVPDSVHFYREGNESNRITAQFQLQRGLNNGGTFVLRNSVSLFERQISISASQGPIEYLFSGEQVNTFSEASYLNSSEAMDIVLGANFYTDHFTEDRIYDFPLRSNEHITVGGFAQHTWRITKPVVLETGVRGDYELSHGFFALPRAALMVKWSRKFTSRLSGAMGYRLPSILVAEAELRAFDGVLPARELPDAERSVGANGDINFKVPVGEQGFFRINQLFFYNRIDDPIFLVDTGSGSGILELQNMDGYVESVGFETSMKLGAGPFTWFVGYTYTEAQLITPTITTDVPLTPTHSIKGDLLFDIPGKWQFAADYEYKSSQLLSNGTFTPDVIIFGFLARYWVGQKQFFVNLENFTDQRQTRYNRMTSGPYNTPQFTEVWMPLEGFYINGGVRFYFTD